ncbi:T6SS immunity protein Tli4 family protein [Burkholderia sp. 9775_39]|uniref:T6SS immunity protein Tli4 family protein n=2 Tax=unclassified Burkholderia TaxID=2613784 RepID=UPI002E7BC0F3|nr:T6SS immunity protein Tli4 family protein [Burkholderia sp. 9775_39]
MRMCWRIICVAAFILILDGCEKGDDKLEKGAVLNKLMDNLKARCVGRYLVDLPSAAVARGSVRFRGVQIEASPMTLNVYDEAMKDLIKARHKYGDGVPTSAHPYVYESGEVAYVKGGYFFITTDSSLTKDSPSKVVEAYKWDRGYRIKISTGATDFLNSSIKDYPSVKNMPAQDQYDVPYKKDLIFDTLKMVQGRADDFIPAEPGLCFVGGFLPGKARYDEAVEESFAVQSMPDVMFTFGTHSDEPDVDNESMVARLPKMRAYVQSAGGRVIRSGSVRLNGMDADEVLVEGPFAPPINGHNFFLEANAAINSPTAPLLTFEMDNGIRTFLFSEGKQVMHASLTEGEAVELWDLISRTVRSRPNGF